MSLDKILDALEAEAEREIGELERSTQTEIERIRARARQKAAAVEQKHVAEIQAPLQAERARILNQARLESLRVVMGARESLIDSVLGAAARRLAALPANPTYAHLLRRLAREAVETLGGNGGLCLRVRDQDVALMRCIALEEMGLAATVEGGLEEEDVCWGCLGGLVATTADGRIRLVNTLNVRLQRVAKLYRAQIAAMLFGE